MNARLLPSGRTDGSPRERKEFLDFYAGVLEREAAARSATQPAFSADLQGWADKARAEAGAIDVRPPQMELF